MHKRKIKIAGGSYPMIIAFVVRIYSQASRALVKNEGLHAFCLHLVGKPLNKGRS